MAISGFEPAETERARYVFMVDDVRNSIPKDSELKKEVARLRKENARLLRELQQRRSRP